MAGNWPGRCASMQQPIQPPLSATSHFFSRGLRRPSSRATAWRGRKPRGVSGATVIVMDDGFQNPALMKELSILLVDSRRGIGNGRIIPAGPLRAPLEAQIARAQAIVVVGSDAPPPAVMECASHHNVCHCFTVASNPDRDTLAAFRGRKVFAFAGIADPEKFFTTLAEGGVVIARRASFPDHHRYSAAEAQALIARADTENLMLVTTEKDLARLTGDPHLTQLAARASALPVRLMVDERGAISANGVGAY